MGGEVEVDDELRAKAEEAAVAAVGCRHIHDRSTDRSRADLEGVDPESIAALEAAAPHDE